MGFLIPAIKVVAGFVAKNVIAKAVVKIAAAAIISKVATKAISKLIAKRGIDAPSGADAGGRVQLPPAADNKLPIIYGTSWIGGPVIDAKISTDQKFMWYVIALCEKPDGQTVTFDTTNGVYYGGKKVVFGSNGVVNALVTNTTPAQSDTKMAGKIYIWLFQDDANSIIGSNSTQTPYQIMTDATTGGGIPDGWSSSIYTSNGESVQLNNMVYAIVRIEYNVDATTTSLDTLQIKVTNNMGGDNGCKPGVALLDYLTNTRYGCAIDGQYIDTASLAALDAYADQYITYIPVEGGYAQQRRYRVNGPLDTGNDCLTNLQFLVDTADSWLQYTETTGKWRVVPNQPYTGSLTSLYNVNDDVLIGGIQINPIDLNDTFNQVEVAYPNTNVKDQTDYQIVDLTDPSTAWYPIYNQVLSPNEAINRLNIALPLVNNAVQAKYLAVRRLLQSREDLVISLQTDYSGIQVDAGDVIRVNHNAYGWTDKLFRVSSVSEVQDEAGNLSALIEAFEYNGTIYADNAIQDFIPADNTGLKDPNVISPPCPPTVTPFTDEESLVQGFTVTSCVPDEGVVIYMDFNYGNSSNVQTHQLYRTVQSAGGIPFINSDSANSYYNNVSITVNDLPANTYYWSATARNDFAGRNSDASSPFNWGGANINPYDPNTGNGGLPPNVYRPNTIPANAIIGGQQDPIIKYNNSNLGQANTLNFIGSSYYANLSNNQANIYITPIAFANSQKWSIELELANTGNINNSWYDLTTSNVRGKPSYIPGGVSINIDNYYPYYSGTAVNTAGSNGNNYYDATSTGPYTPSQACVLIVENGDDNWYVLANNIIDGSKLSANNTLLLEIGLQFVSDIDCEFQLLTGLMQAGGNGLYVTKTVALNTLTAYANIPYQYQQRQDYYGSAIAGAEEGVILVRNLTPNANLQFTNGSFINYYSLPI